MTGTLAQGGRDAKDLLHPRGSRTAPLTRTARTGTALTQSLLALAEKLLYQGLELLSSFGLLTQALLDLESKLGHSLGDLGEEQALLGGLPICAGTGACSAHPGGTVRGPPSRPPSLPAVHQVLDQCCNLCPIGLAQQPNHPRRCGVQSLGLAWPARAAFRA